MEFILCNKQYVGKAETSFNTRMNDSPKDVKKVDAIMTFKNFQQKSHNFNKHAEFTIIDQLTNTFKSKETLTQQLNKKEKFWILKLDRVSTWNLVNSKGNNFKKDF